MNRTKVGVGSETLMLRCVSLETQPTGYLLPPLMSAASRPKVYDSEEDMLESLARKEITPGMVVVIRYEGPKGGPGMPEMLTPSSAIMGAGLGSSVALITDGRFSGGSHG